jgi:hypothetical protein
VALKPEAALAEIAARQHGAFAMRQANSVGISGDVLGMRVEAGAYRRHSLGVYVVNAAPDTWMQQVSCAVLSSGGDAAASHQTAAFLHSLTPRRGPAIEVVVRRWTREHREHTVHESKDLIEDDVGLVGGIRTTTPVRTIVDLGASAPRWLVESCLDEGLRRGVFDVAGIQRLIRRVARRGRRGVGVIRPLVELRETWSITTESPLEDAFLRLVTAGSLPMPVAQYEVRSNGSFVCRADFAYPEFRVLVELDGERWHMDRATFQRDRTKQNRAGLLGWTVLRYTWDDVVNNPHVVVHQLHTVLA